MKQFTMLFPSSVFVLGSFCPSGIDCKQYCKPVPSSAGWPSTRDWQSLNQTVSGRLIGVVPPGAVCHPDRPQFNEASCAVVKEQWSNTTYHSDNPVSVDSNDFTCAPDAASPCSADGYPAYILAATSVEDVQAGVKFAHKTGVRLTVKGTGHDFLGRSSGSAALNIWTHNIRGIEVEKNPRPGPSGEVATMKIYAGMQARDVLSVASDNNLTALVGADLNVGIGGWLTGTGHSPVSAVYGMGADQALEMEVVTADGRYLTINERSNKDLFWAMRGGGGSTYAVLISVTVRAYPALAMSRTTFSLNTTANSETFWEVNALIHSYLPSLAKNEVMGYYGVLPDVSLLGFGEKQAAFTGSFVQPGKSQAEADKTFSPLIEAINKEQWKDEVGIQISSTDPVIFSESWQNNDPQTANNGQGYTRLGSWLLDTKSLQTDRKVLTQKLKQATGVILLGHVVSSPGASKVRIPGGSNAVNPAWRKAVTHVIAPVSWTPFNAAMEKQVTENLRNVQTRALMDLAPDSGAYASESDPTVENFQRDFWGSNYARLFEIKKRYDPDGVFWCKTCVGSELWITQGGDGVGQSLARICRR